MSLAGTLMALRDDDPAGIQAGMNRDSHFLLRIHDTRRP
jgi:hypothetical protein